MAMFTNKRIMVVAAHPDDELLGLGATMHKLVNDLWCLAGSLVSEGVQA